MMEVYLVGGAVRDTLLNFPVSERDYVVVGATVQQMLDLGFSQVGADFPVFLHPDSHEEYALARTERKTGNGYLGFQIHSNPNVTLTEDLSRRDLTINAMAIQVQGLFDNRIKTGEIIDPFGGQDDLQNHALRHVSPAFSEDPVRVLRLARFASRYAPLGFYIADETKQLVDQIKQSGELNHLVAERVWTETHKALSQPWSDVYFETLYQLNVLDVIMPPLFEVLKSMLPSDYQTWQTALRLANQCQLDHISQFAVFSSIFLPFTDHQSAWQTFCERLKIPKTHQNLSKIFLENFQQICHFHQLNAEQIFDLLQRSQALKQPERLQTVIVCCHLYQIAKQQQQIHDLVSHLQQISAKDVAPDLQGKAIGDAIEQLRKQSIETILKQTKK